MASKVLGCKITIFVMFFFLFHAAQATLFTNFLNTLITGLFKEFATFYSKALSIKLQTL